MLDFPERTQGDQELYELSRDPHEQHDLAADPTYREELESLRSQALQWWEQE
jgi:hypothetical protein